MKAHISRIRGQHQGWQMAYIDPMTGFKMRAYSYDWSRLGLRGAIKFFRNIPVR